MVVKLLDDDFYPLVKINGETRKPTGLKKGGMLDFQGRWYIDILLTCYMYVAMSVSKIQNRNKDLRKWPVVAPFFVGENLGSFPFSVQKTSQIWRNFPDRWTTFDSLVDVVEISNEYRP